MKQIQVRDHEQDNNIILFRIKIAICVIAVCFCIIFARYYYLQIIKHDFYLAASMKNRIQTRPITPNRGLILDRNGVVLANNKPSFNLNLTTEYIKNLDEFLGKLAKLLKLNEKQIAQIKIKIKQTRRRPYEAVQIISDLTQEQVAKLAVNEYDLPGIEVYVSFLRNYPFNDLFAHSIGYIGRISQKEQETINKDEYAGLNFIGKTGIERFYEKQLHGISGFEEVEVNASGRILNSLNVEEAIAGSNLTLTIDLELQQVAQNLLKGEKGAIVAIEPKTGDILAMVSAPSYDANDFVTGISYTAYDALRLDPNNPLYNRASQGAYPPGSTIKPVMAIAGLDAGVINTKSRVLDRGYYTLPGSKHQYRNWNRGGDGWISFYDAMARSNDTFFYDLAHKLGVDKIHHYLSQFGIGQKVAVDILGEQKGVAPSKEWKMQRYNQPWYAGDTVQLGIGQGTMLLTPLQLAQAITIIANKGKFVRPHLLKKENGIDFIDNENPFKDIKLKNDEYWDNVWQAMLQVVNGSNGTGRRAGEGLPYKVAGKSGTAQIVGIKQGAVYASNKLLKEHRDHALFVAFAPVPNPQIVVAVIVENGEGGGKVAAPVAREVLKTWIEKKRK